MGKRRGVRSLLDNLKMDAIREGADEDASVMSGMHDFTDSESPRRSPRRSLLGGGSPLSASPSEGNDSLRAYVKQATGVSNSVPAPPLETKEKVATIEEGEEEDSSASTEKTTDDESSEEKNNNESTAAAAEQPKADEPVAEEKEKEASGGQDDDNEEEPSEEDDEEGSRQGSASEPPEQKEESHKRTPQGSRPAMPEEKRDSPTQKAPQSSNPASPEQGPDSPKKKLSERPKPSSSVERRGGPRRKEHRRRHPHREKSREKHEEVIEAKEQEFSSPSGKNAEVPEHPKLAVPEERKEQVPMRRPLPEDKKEQAPTKPASPEETKEPAPTKPMPPEEKREKAPRTGSMGSSDEKTEQAPKPPSSEEKKEQAPRKPAPEEKKEQPPRKKEHSKEKKRGPPKEVNSDREKSEEASKEPKKSNHSSTNNSELDLSSLGDSESRLTMADDDFSQMSSVAPAEADFDGDASFALGLPEMEEEDDEQLTWRLDPDLSLSDWTVLVRNKDDNSVATYYLHKNILAVGSRKSEYFFTAFRKSREEPTDPPNTTKLAFEGVAAKVFPQVWDYIYSQDGRVEFTTENIMGLRHLAKFFGIKALYKLATEFLPTDITMANIVTYYKNSTALKDDRTLYTAAKHCARNILRIDTSHELLPVIDTQFFKRILTDVGDGKAKRYHCSILVAEYFKLHKATLDTASFLSLVDEKLLPLIHHKVALDLLELEADVVVVTASILKFTEASSLQRRCIKDLSVHWKEFSDLERDDISRVCRKLSSGVVTDLLIKTLAQVKRKANKAEPSDSSVTSETAAPVAPGPSDEKPKPTQKGYEAKLAEVEKAHMEEVSSLKKQYESNLKKLRDLCVEKDKHIANYWQELQRYKRLPNTLDGKLVSSGMMNKPSKMPGIGNEPIDGQLYIEKKGGKQKYPMFYYKAD